MAQQKPMSLEAVMDEERREVLALLGGGQAKRSPSVTSGGRSASPLDTLQPPVRSMFDSLGENEVPPLYTPSAPTVGSNSPRPPAQPTKSMLNIDASPSAAPIRSMLDVDAPASPSLKPVTSAQTSPTEANPRVNSPASIQHHHHHHGSSGSGSGSLSLHPRSMSDAATRPSDFGPRTRNDPTSSYQFADIITSRETPRRASQTPAHGPTAHTKRTPSSMAEVIRGADVSNLKLPGHVLPLRGKPAAKKSRGPTSKSPHNRLAVRSKSPHIALNSRNLSPAGKAFLADSNGIDMQVAYRRLSDANLVRAGGSLGVLAMRKRSDDAGSNGGRLTKDYVGPDGQELLEDSSEDNRSFSDDDDEGERGRKVARNFHSEKSPSSSISPEALRKDPRTPLSLLAAAEEERIQVASSKPAYKYRSLLDEPEITVTNPSGEKVKAPKPPVHPASSFDVGSRSQSRAPWDSEDEAEYSDIKRAQKMSFSMTPTMSTPEIQRSIRIIYRGDLAKVQREAIEEEHRRIRKYLVATDLSDESTHALEWAIGTVLRDGDTLIAIYCVDEETGIPGCEGQDEPKTTREQAAAVSATTSAKLPELPSVASLATASASNAAMSIVGSTVSRSSLLMRNVGDMGTGTGSSSPAPGQERSKAEEERHRAVRDITDRITRLLRKTRLQVRVIVEVLQCKTPRHLITEVIDLVNPTLVILGSRGRSALKGVILGSFSNYLVTKSSVPVMVARKRLRKQSKFKRTPVQQVNNLSNPAARSLANAKID